MYVHLVNVHRRKNVYYRRALILCNEVLSKMGTKLTLPYLQKHVSGMQVFLRNLFYFKIPPKISYYFP